MFKILAILSILPWLLGCQTVFDPSIPAAEANDKTLIGAMVGGPCAALPSQGADVCKFQENSPVRSDWVLVIPKSFKSVSGQVKVASRDFVKTYSIQSNEVVIPLQDFFQFPTWKLGDDRILSALAEFRYKDRDGIEKLVRAEAMAIIIVLKQGYNPMPLNSGFQTWDITCDKRKVQYSTKGRSSLGCK